MKKKLFLSCVLVATGMLANAVPSTVGTANKILNTSAIQERVQQFRQIVTVLQNQYVDTLDIESIIKSGFDAMLAKVDPYTEYYDADNIEQLTMVSSGKYGGIGCSVTLRDSLVEVADVYFDKPARLAGLRHGDIILQIDDYDIPAEGITINDVSNRLKGNPGTHVTLKVRRPWLPEGSDSILFFDIERKNISFDPVPYSVMFDDGVAFIDVSTFDVNTGNDVRKIVTDLKSRNGKNLKGIIIDLRANGGGVMGSAVDLVSVFVDKGTKVVETRYRGGASEAALTKKSPVDAAIPIVVIVNENTASAAEVVAGAIQDLDRGVILGRRTYGKGLVQTSAPLGYNSVLKYTTGKYYLPSGRLIQARDYRDEDGKESMIPDSLTHEFRTAGGRVVRDGRGIMPDYVMKGKEVNPIVWQISNGSWIDDFSNRYRNTHDTIGDIRQLVDETLFDEFVSGLDPEKISYGEYSKKGIGFIRSAVEYEGLQNDSTKAVIDQLEKLLEHDLKTELEANRGPISELLVYTLSERYFSPEVIEAGIIEQDEDVLEARALILDTERYREYLAPKTKN